MDSLLYDAAIKDDIDVLKEMEHRLSVHDQLTPTKSTVLHLACQHGSIKCVQHILSLHKSLLLKINIRCETALHLAAREGHHEVIVALIDAAKSSILETNISLQKMSLTCIQHLIRTSNVENETALHAAVRYNHKNVVQLLVHEDPGHSHTRSKYDETPLYLASIRGYTDIIRIILANCKSPSCGGPDGRTALHAALLDHNGHDCVKLLLEKKKDLINIADDKGLTAFHYAAFNDLYTIVEDLVGADKFVGYLPDYVLKRIALHMAANEGNVQVMKKLVEYYPDSLEIVDRNGHNILHIAVRQDQKEVIRFILSLGCTAIKNLLIQGDSNGNTPLHWIAKLGCYVQELMDLTTVDWEAMVRTTLINAKVKGQHLWISAAGPIEVQDVKTEKTGVQRVIETIQKVINTHIIVAALIATVALTAGFAMPGGFDGNQGPTRGSPMLLRKTAFQTFIVTDALALLFSISSLFLYFATILYHHPIVAQKFFALSTLLNVLSIMAMVLAFITGTYAVLAHSLALAISVCVISSIFFLLCLYLLAKFIPKSNFVIESNFSPIE